MDWLTIQKLMLAGYVIDMVVGKLKSNFFIQG